MNIWAAIVAIGFFLQGVGVIGYLASTEVFHEIVNTRVEQTVIDMRKEDGYVTQTRFSMESDDRAFWDTHEIRRKEPKK